MATINRFLQDCLKSVSAPRPLKDITFVLGNEGGDMDSVVGSLYLAFYLAKNVAKHEEGTPSPVVPLLNFAVEDLPLRGDIDALLKEEGIDASHYCSTEVLVGTNKAEAGPTFLDVSLDAENTTLSPSAQFVLFDHNALCKRQAHLGHRVVGIVDHHADEKKYTECPSNPFGMRDIRVIGSASSLVALLYGKANMPVPSPKLLFAPVTLDTYNFDAKMERVTDADVAARDALLPQIDTEFDQVAFYEKLKANKFDVSSLTCAQALRRDYKVFPMQGEDNRSVLIGISSHLELFDAFSTRLGVDAMVADLDKYRAQGALDVLMIMFAANVGDELVRQLLVYYPNETNASVVDLINGLTAAEALAAAKLETMDVAIQLDASAPGKLFLYHQRNNAFSRKTLTPRLADYVKAKL